MGSLPKNRKWPSLKTVLGEDDLGEDDLGEDDLGEDSRSGSWIFAGYSWPNSLDASLEMFLALRTSEWRGSRIISTGYLSPLRLGPLYHHRHNGKHCNLRQLSVSAPLSPNIRGRPLCRLNVTATGFGGVLIVTEVCLSPFSLVTVRRPKVSLVVSWLK